MKSRILGALMVAALFGLGAYAQSSMPAPGTSVGGGGGWGGGNSLMAPGQPGGPMVGWGPGMGNFGPAPAPVGYPGWQNYGTETVIASGYDVYGVQYQIPMRVHYWYNGINYNATVLSAYNPDIDMWEYSLNIPAVNTSYFFRGTMFNFYAPLSFGTFYFNI